LKNNNYPIDHRDPLIYKQLKEVKHALLVVSGKGGVGKSLISATTSLLIARAGKKVGLLDLDLHGPSSIKILNVRDKLIEEKVGLIPPVSAGVKVVSLDSFVEGRIVPVSGHDKVQIVKELLALTYWGEIDLLVIDLPPETGDVTVTVSKYLPCRKAALLVTIPTIISIRVVKRAAELMKILRIPIAGLVVNMAYLEVGDKIIRPFGFGVSDFAEKIVVGPIDELPLDPAASLAADRGDVDGLINTKFAAKLRGSLLNLGILS